MPRWWQGREESSTAWRSARHLFGNEDFFPGAGRYTLEPLRTAGSASIVCTDVDGMDWVRLKEIQLLWGGVEREIETRKADDLFAALEGRGRSIPGSAPIIRARFQVKFADAKTARAVTIRTPNTAQYTRDSDRRRRPRLARETRLHRTGSQ